MAHDDPLVFGHERDRQVSRMTQRGNDVLLGVGAEKDLTVGLGRQRADGLEVAGGLVAGWGLMRKL